MINFMNLTWKNYFLFSLRHSSELFHTLISRILSYEMILIRAKLRIIF